MRSQRLPTSIRGMRASTICLASSRHSKAITSQPKKAFAGQLRENRSSLGPILTWGGCTKRTPPQTPRRCAKRSTFIGACSNMTRQTPKRLIRVPLFCYDKAVIRNHSITFHVSLQKTRRARRPCPFVAPISLDCRTARAPTTQLGG